MLSTVSFSAIQGWLNQTALRAPGHPDPASTTLNLRRLVLTRRDLSTRTSPPVASPGSEIPEQTRSGGAAVGARAARAGRRSSRPRPWRPPPRVCADPAQPGRFPVQNAGVRPAHGGGEQAVSVRVRFRTAAGIRAERQRRRKPRSLAGQQPPPARLPALVKFEFNSVPGCGRRSRPADRCPSPAITVTSSASSAGVRWLRPAPIRRRPGDDLAGDETDRVSRRNLCVIPGRRSIPRP